MNVGVVIQARMGSSRLPGKVLLDIGGRSMLGHVLDRVRLARRVDSVILATTTKAIDDCLVDAARAESVAVYRGDEDDVLDRYHQAAQAHGLDVVVRVTSDCPLLDPGIVDEVVAPLVAPASRVEFSANILDRAFPRGLDAEASTAPALERIWRTATAPQHRAHTFAYVYDHRDEFTVASVTDAVDRSHMRWTVDTAEDLAFVREVYARLGSREYTWRDVLKVLDRNQELLHINELVRQKAAHEL